MSAETAWAVFAIMATLLTGVLIPTLLSLRDAAKGATALLEAQQKKLDGLETRVEQTLVSVDEAVRTLTEGVAHARNTLAVVDTVSSRAEQVSGVAAMAAALVPAVASAVAAFRSQSSSHSENASQNGVAHSASA